MDDDSNDTAAAIAETRAQFGSGPKPIDSVERRLQAWAEICRGGAMNLVNVDGVGWSWSTAPRIQKNGSAIGRVYRQRKGGLCVDAGSYKIDAKGKVLQLPAELRAVLPGGESAEISADAETETSP
jgi:hypothetical protein